MADDIKIPHGPTKGWAERHRGSHSQKQLQATRAKESIISATGQLSLRILQLPALMLFSKHKILMQPTIYTTWILANSFHRNICRPQQASRNSRGLNRRPPKPFIFCFGNGGYHPSEPFLRFQTWKHSAYWRKLEAPH